MAKEIIVAKSAKKAIVDDLDFDRVNAHKWFMDRGQIYTKIMVPIDNDPHHRSYPIKIRMDRFILRLTTHNFVRINHMLNDPYDNTRYSMFRYALPKVEKTRGMTRYLGVKKKKGFIVAEYRNAKGILLQIKHYPISQTIDEFTLRSIEDVAARQYDKWAREEEGDRAKTNFLPDSIYK